MIKMNLGPLFVVCVRCPLTNTALNAVIATTRFCCLSSLGGFNTLATMGTHSFKSMGHTCCVAISTRFGERTIRSMSGEGESYSVAS